MQVTNDDLIAKAYEAAVDEALWPGLAHDMAASLGCHSAAVQVRSLVEGTKVLSYTPNIDIPSYELRYGEMDVWVQGAVHQGMNRVLLSHEFIDERQFVRSEFYADFAKRCDQHYLIGALLEVAPGQIGGFGVHRTKSGGQFTRADREQMAIFASHLRRALRLRSRLMEVSEQHRWSLACLSQANASFFVLDRNCKLVYVSPDAAMLVAERQPFQVQFGRLSVRNVEQQHRFAHLVAAAVDTASGKPAQAADSLLVERATGAPVSLAISPLPRLSDNAPCALVFVKDAAKGAANEGRLQSVFGLTKAEATVAADLVRGWSPAEIAQRRDVGEPTVRTHLHRILAKTKTARQAEFVALALRTVATCES